MVFAPPRRVLLLPVPAVGLSDHHFLDRAQPASPRVERKSIRPFERAELNRSYASGLTVVEAVGGQHFTAAKQGKPVGRYDQMQVAGPAADRAVAFGHADPRGRQHLEYLKNRARSRARLCLRASILCFYVLYYSLSARR